MFSLTSSLSHFRADRRGGVAILFALSSLVVVGVAGAAIDVGQAQSKRTKLKTIVDAAAIAGASLPATASENRIDIALRIFNGNTADTEFSGLVPKIDASNAGVTVRATTSHGYSIMKIFGLDGVQLTAETTARSQVQNGGVMCLLALNRSTADGLHLQGINKVSSDNCWAWVNSTHSTSINAVGASMGAAQGFCTAGGVAGADHFQPAPYTKCEPMADPFYTKMANYSTRTTCDHTNLQLGKGTHTLQPGVYCGNTILKPQAVVTFQPGLYVMQNGYFQIQAGSSAIGNGVTFFFRGMNTRMEIRGGGEVDFKAPTTGDMAGFVIVDRKLDWYDATIRETEIQGGGRVKLEGILYAPQWRINVGGNGQINQESKYFAMIADSFYMEGNGRMFLRSDAVGAGLPALMPPIKNGPVVLF